VILIPTGTDTTGVPGTVITAAPDDDAAKLVQRICAALGLE